jgi:hypothetical protein
VAVAELTAAEPVVVRTVPDEAPESFLEIFAQPGGERLVTSVEVLSLTNKTPGTHGRGPYVEKQREILDSKVHLVEIDLLRSGTHTTAVALDAAIAMTGGFDYHVCVRPFDRPAGEFLVYPIWLRNRLPVIAVPLLPGDQPVQVDLQSVLDKVYDTGRYARRVRYRDWVPVPPLGAELRAWTDQVLRAAQLIGPPPTAGPL